jgi:hypothetical protein
MYGSGGIAQLLYDILHYSGFNSTKSPARGTCKVSEPIWCYKWKWCAKRDARKSECFCSQSGEGVSTGLPR